MNTHESEWTLRRLSAGELAAAERPRPGPCGRV